MVEVKMVLYGAIQEYIDDVSSMWIGQGTLALFACQLFKS